MSSNNSKPKTEKVVETKAEDVKPEVKAEEIDKLALAKKTLAAEKEKEADKQKGIYSVMGSFQIIRN